MARVEPRKLTVYGDRQSGNCYKVALLLAYLEMDHDWVHIDILDSESRTPDFLAMNPNGKIPTIDLGGGEYLWESNAILNYLAEGTPYLPADRLSRARVLQWQYFEQYSHEPYIAVARFIAKYLGMPPERRAEFEDKQSGGRRALGVMESALAERPYFVGDTVTIADISLYAYTHVAHEGGFALDDYPSVRRWLGDVASQPRHVTMNESVSGAA